MADPKFQMADGSFPINTCADVSDAAKLAHHSKTYSFDQVRAHVMKAKNALGCPDSVLPDTWTSDSGQNAMPAGMVERRYFPLTGVQVETRDGGNPTIRGHAAVFNSLSENLGFFRERILPGAFRDSLRQDEIVALFNHDPNYPLGATYDGRLKLSEDRDGLFMEVKPTSTSYAADLVTNIRGGLVRRQSFSFTVPPGGQNWGREGGVEVRELNKVRILDVSPVMFPAYTATDVQVRHWVQEAGLDFEGLSGAMVRCFRGLELASSDRDLINEATERLPILRSAVPGQASGSRTMTAEPLQAWALAILQRRRELAAKS